MDAVEADLVWTVGGAFGMELHGSTHQGEHVATVVCTSDGTWTFMFPGYGGRGTIQVGNGCDYNPLHMVEILRNHFIDPELMNQSSMRQFSPQVDKADFDPNWVSWDDGWSKEWS